MKNLIIPPKLNEGDTVAFISISGGRAGDARLHFIFDINFYNPVFFQHYLNIIMLHFSFYLSGMLKNLDIPGNHPTKVVIFFKKRTIFELCIIKNIILIK